MKYILATTSLLALIVLPAHAEKLEPMGLKLDTYLTTQVNALQNPDLGSANRGTGTSLSQQARLRASYKFSNKVESLLDARAIATTGDTGIEDETGHITANKNYLELRQLWIKFSGLNADKTLSFQAGRQRIREEQGLWWNKDIEAARLLYDTPKFKGFAGLAEAFSDYRTYDGAFREEDQGRFRALGEGSWQWQKDHKLEARALYESDHSGSGHAGQVIPAFDRDDDDGNLLWVGLRAAGAFKGLMAGTINYKLDAMGVGGHEEDVTSAAIPGTQTRLITGKKDRDVLGWALDARTDIELEAPLHPTFTFGYSYASGDDGNGTDHAFRQTGLQSNSSNRSGAAIYDYGEVFRPELSNLHILTAGASLPIDENANIGLFYHYYRLAEQASDVRYSLITAPLNGTDKYLGQEADLVMNINLYKSLDIKNTFLKDIKLRSSLGVFQAGDAYATINKDNAVRGFSELVFRF